MSRSVSSGFKAAIFAQETSEAFLVLLTIDHDDLSSPIRVSSDAVDTVSRGNTFIAFPFELTLPDDDENSSPRAQLNIDNIDRQVVLAIRSISSTPTVLIEIVQASDPDTVEASFPDFRFENISYNDMVVSGELTIEDFASEPFPARIFSPADFPGLF